MEKKFKPPTLDDLATLQKGGFSDEGVLAGLVFLGALLVLIILIIWVAL
jgi:hypothetical protein